MQISSLFEIWCEFAVQLRRDTSFRWPCCWLLVGNEESDAKADGAGHEQLRAHMDMWGFGLRVNLLAVSREWITDLYSPLYKPL